MKISNLTIIISLILLCFFVASTIDQSLTKKQHTVSKELTQGLSESMYDTAIAVTWEIGGEESRNKLVEEYSKKLAYSLGWSVGSDIKDSIMLKIPVIVICDNSGYWMYYTDTYTDKQGSSLYTKTTSPKQSYCETYGDYCICFGLDGICKVYSDKSGKIYEGNITEIIKQLNYPTEFQQFLGQYRYLSESQILDNYLKQAHIVAADMVKSSIESMVEEHLYGTDAVYSYEFDIPQAQKERLRNITGSCIIAMYQGPTMQSTNGWIDVYSLAAAEIQEDTEYYVKCVEENGQSIMYYHKDNCNKGDLILYKGNRVECAKYGAFPCPDCID